MADAEALTPRVFIVRHGETEWAKLGRQTGKTDIELTPLGIKQVLTTASHLVGTGKLLDPSKLARVFVSPRKRTQQTLQGLLGSELDALKVKGVEVTTTEDIAEWDYGEYEGLRLPEIRARRRERGLDGEGVVWNVWRDGCEGGEVKEQVTERVDRVIKAIREIQGPCMSGQGAADVLVVAHGVILRAFVMRWLGYPLEMPLNMMLAPGAVGVLSYKNNSVDEPAFHVGMALPVE
ncbi:phosphoglycerate mutase [Podospora aff. communis PSN243]|uniref:Phosphoglycerate mutase n=1 Tax=Podospora aff. communis PSN243 TaxID=3040156 RepID=A0AAV9GSG7_9PEZI|nr:phosphoglycerate mutase [Podospora aff. communis PSN243]